MPDRDCQEKAQSVIEYCMTSDSMHELLFIKEETTALRRIKDS